MASTAIAPCSTFSKQKIAGPPACSTTFLCAPKWIASTAPVSHRVLRSPLPIELPFCGPSPCSSYSFRFLFGTAGSRSWSASAFQESNGNVPTPIVTIDQDSDPNATVVEISFGDRLGALIDTMRALKDLRLDVVKGNVTTDPLASVIRTKFFITRSDTGRKVENPEMIEAIRLTIIRNLLKYHPESSESLAMGEALGMKAPAKTIDADIATHIQIVDDGPKRSLLTLETADRPGLLTEVVQIMNDINVSVESAEIDTEGLVAKDKFHVNYHGQALNKSLAEVLTNCLRYHLRKPITDEESY